MCDDLWELEVSEFKTLQHKNLSQNQLISTVLQFRTSFSFHKVFIFLVIQRDWKISLKENKENKYILFWRKTEKVTRAETEGSKNEGAGEAEKNNTNIRIPLKICNISAQIQILVSPLISQVTSSSVSLVALSVLPSTHEIFEAIKWDNTYKVWVSWNKAKAQNLITIYGGDYFKEDINFTTFIIPEDSGNVRLFRGLGLATNNVETKGSHWDSQALVALVLHKSMHDFGILRSCL